MYKNLVLLFIAVCTIVACKPDRKKGGKTPEVYTAVFETNKGDFEVEITRKWSPAAADRFYRLVDDGFYDSVPFYRVVSGFVAQFGSIDRKKMAPWKKIKLPDEPVLHSNAKGTITFAREGKDSRATDVFINLKDNTLLDTMLVQGVRGYTPFGRVKEGFEVVEALYSGYGELAMQHPEMFVSKEKFSKGFPKVDKIKKAYITSAE